MMNLILFDLDGTIALIEHRRHFVEGETKDWTAFYAACPNDKPNGPVIELMPYYRFGDDEIWILSGRSAEVRAETEAWLAKHEIMYDRLLMRPEGDFTPDEELKKAWYFQHEMQGRVRVVYDDRDKVVKMWRELGLTCFQVAPGDF